MVRGLLQPSHTFAQHLESGSQTCVLLCEDFGRGLCDSGVHVGFMHVDVVTGVSTVKGGLERLYEDCEGGEKDGEESSMRFAKVGSYGEGTA